MASLLERWSSTAGLLTDEAKVWLLLVLDSRLMTARVRENSTYISYICCGLILVFFWAYCQLSCWALSLWQKILIISMYWCIFTHTWMVCYIKMNVYRHFIWLDILAHPQNLSLLFKRYKYDLETKAKFYSPALQNLQELCYVQATDFIIHQDGSHYCAISQTTIRELVSWIHGMQKWVAPIKPFNMITMWKPGFLLDIRGGPNSVNF